MESARCTSIFDLSYQTIFSTYKSDSNCDATCDAATYYRIFDGIYTALCAIFMIWVSLENVKKKMFWVVARSTLFEIFSHSAGCFGAAPFEKKIQTTLILAFETNGALSRENETKIVKITHSALEATPAHTK